MSTRFQTCQSNFCSGLLCFFLAAPFGVRELLLCEPYFHFKCFLMFGAEFVTHTVLNGAQSALLQPFLESGLVIGAIQASNLATKGAIEQCVAKELARGGKSGIQINRAEDGFVRVGEQTVFYARPPVFSSPGPSRKKSPR